MAEEWKKVNLAHDPFSFSNDEWDDNSSDYLTGEYGEVYNKAVHHELGGKNLEYSWSEEGHDSPSHLDEFEGGDDWEPVFAIDAQNCCDFGYVTMAKRKTTTYFHGVRWAIIFECLTPIWIREKGEF
tara:strand:+ start:1788 stop:2168 length:381 start_codon:yes stop_codon:yes gene_type:complete